MFNRVAHYGALRIIFKTMAFGKKRVPITGTSRRGTDIPGSTLGSGSIIRPGAEPRDPLYDFPQNSGNQQVWEDFLNSKGLTNISDESKQALFDLLNGYAKNGTDTTERNDMFYQFLLQQIANQDQRSFDLSQLSDQRLYDSPTNQLARLMGAGISRDAAIQMLQGVQGAGVAGSVGAAAPGVSAPSGTMQQAALNTALNWVSVLNTLMMSGVQMAQGIETVTALQMQNYMSEQQKNAYDSVQQVSQQLQTLDASGKINMSDFSNAQDLLNFLQKNKDNDEFASLVNSPALSTALGTTLGREYFNRHWHAVRNTRDAGTLADEFIRMQKLNNAIAELQPDKIGAEIAKIGQDMKESDQRIIESCSRIAQGDAQIQYLNKQGEWIDVQMDVASRTADAQIDLVKAQTSGQFIANKSANLNYEYNEAGFPMLKQARIDELELQMNKWAAIKAYYYNPTTSIDGSTAKERKDALDISAWLADPQNAADAAYLQHIYKNAVGDFAVEHPQLFKLCQACQKVGLFDAVRTGGETATAAKAVKAFVTRTP